MKRIMIVTNSLTGGGAERSMNLVCNELTDRGWPISLVPINSGPQDQVIPICDVFPLERQWMGSLANTISAVWKFHQVVKSWNPDIVVLNCALPELFGATLLGKHNLVVLEHSNNPWVQRAVFGKIVRRILTLRKSTWVAVSSHLAIWPNGKMPSAILQNPLTPRERTMPHSIGNEIQRLLFIGRLSPEKRPNIVLEISQHTGIKLEIIGDGVLRAALEKEALDKQVKARFRGRIDNPWSEIQSGDLLIVPSAFEGDGLVVIEGLQHEIPMFLVDIPDLRRFGFPDSNYWTNIKDSVSRIKSFKNDIGKLKIPSNVSEEILKTRMIGTIGDSWVELLTRLN